MRHARRRVASGRIQWPNARLHGCTRLYGRGRIVCWLRHGRLIVGELHSMPGMAPLAKADEDKSHKELMSAAWCILGAEGLLLHVA